MLHHNSENLSVIYDDGKSKKAQLTFKEVVDIIESIYSRLVKDYSDEQVLIGLDFDWNDTDLIYIVPCIIAVTISNYSFVVNEAASVVITTKNCGPDDKTIYENLCLKNNNNIVNKEEYIKNVLYHVKTSGSSTGIPKIINSSI